MIKQIGTKIYYCKLTGNVIKVIGDMQGYVIETNFDEDYEIYTELKERDKTSIGLLQYAYGEYPALSKNSTGCYFNLVENKLVFTYDELPIPPQEPTEIEIMQSKISTLELENATLKQELESTQQAVNELMLIIILGGCRMIDYLALRIREGLFRL